MSEKRKILRQQVKAEADQLEVDVEDYRAQGRDGDALSAAARRLALEVALAVRLPDLLAWLNDRLTGAGKKGRE